MFDNKFASLGENFYSIVAPTPFQNPVLVSWNDNASKLVGIRKSAGIENYFCGKEKFVGADYIASVYAGHQFGTYVPELGDGRAIMIGEANGWEIQLKGSGKTPYSRFGDGRAVLRSCIREYLCSEALHNLQIESTRALCIVGSDEPVQREEVESAAMLTRLAPTHIRFGHFEYFYYSGKIDELKTLADFTIANYFAGANYDEFFEEVVLRTAKLVAKWQAAGWAHGVMNTDNMSIIGITIDFGPFGFLDKYNSGFVCNHSDHSGRYAFDQQPSIAFWNLNALAQALSPLVRFDKAVEILQKFQTELVAEYSRLMRTKLGLKERHESDVYLVRDILNVMEQNQTDYTNFFRNLAVGEIPEGEGFAEWFNNYTTRLQMEDNPNWSQEMNLANPKYILRNYLAENAIKKAEQGDYTEIDKLLNILENPYSEQPENENYSNPPPAGAEAIEVSCSS